MLTLENLTVKLGNMDFCFELSNARDSCVAILGESGSGKSTLLNLIGGFLQENTGKLCWDNSDIRALSPSERPVTTLFQSHNLFAHMTIEDNLGLGLDPGLHLTNEDRQQLSESLNAVGLGGFEQRKPGQLSGGQLQRAALARCLLRRKPVLLLDEPFSALDEATRREMQILTRRVAEENKLCTLIVTHNPDDAKALDARMLTMKEGRLLES